jgi:NitT/TauT family transport system substrate-binding protein
MMPTIDRRSLLKIAFAGSTLVLFADGGLATESIAIGAAGADAAYAAIYVAIKNGYFAEEGLNTEHVDSQSGPRGKQMLSAKQIFASSSGSSDSVALTMAGKPAVLIFSMEKRPAGANIIVTRRLFDAGLRSVKDLAGRTIGVTQPQGWTWLLGAYITEAANLRTPVELKPLGDLTTMLAAVKSNAVDGCVATFPMVEQAVQQEWGSPIFRVGNEEDWGSVFSGDLPGTGLFVLKDAIDQKPDVLQKLVNGLVKASDFLRRSSAEEIAGTIHADYLPGTQSAALVRGINEYKSVWNYENECSPADYERLLDVMGHGRMYATADLGEKAKFADAVDMSFVRYARHRA